MKTDQTPESILEIQKQLLALSEKRSQLSNQRTKMAATRCYMNAERTLSVWVRTSLAAMIFGIAIDRFGFMIKGNTLHAGTLFNYPNTSTTVIGAILILFSVLMSLSAGWRFIIYTKHYRKEFPLPYHHPTWLPITYAAMVVFFGSLLFLFVWFYG